jgi:hypothetical protein
MRKTYKLESNNSNTASTLLIMLLVIITIVIIFFVIFKWTASTKLPSYCNKKGCNCCNMPREPNVLTPQPDGWDCVDCPDGDIIMHASRGWVTLDVKGIESKIKSYNIDVGAHKNFKCLLESMKAKKLDDCMKSLWPKVEKVPKYLCWRSWKYNNQTPNIFEYTPCQFQSNFNILLPNSNSIEVAEFSKWWHTGFTQA